MSSNVRCDAETAKNVISVFGKIMRGYPGNARNAATGAKTRRAMEKSTNPVLDAILEAAAKLKESSTCKKCLRTNQCRTEAEEQLKKVHSAAEGLTKKLLYVEEELEENKKTIERLLREQEAEAELEKELEDMRIHIIQLKLQNQKLRDKNAELQSQL